MNNLDLPVTRYAVNGDINIAYQAMGTGPLDIIMVPASFRMSNSCMR